MKNLQISSSQMILYLTFGVQCQMVEVEGYNCCQIENMLLFDKNPKCFIDTGLSCLNEHENAINLFFFHLATLKFLNSLQV